LIKSTLPLQFLKFSANLLGGFGVCAEILDYLLALKSESQFVIRPTAIPELGGDKALQCECATVLVGQTQ